MYYLSYLQRTWSDFIMVSTYEPLRSFMQWLLLLGISLGGYHGAVAQASICDRDITLGQQVSGDTRGMPNNLIDYSGINSPVRNCINPNNPINNGGFTGGEEVYRICQIDMPERILIEFNTGGLDLTLSILETCGDASTTIEQIPQVTNYVVDLPEKGGRTYYYLVVDGFNGNEGAFDFTVFAETPEPICDAIIDVIACGDTKTTSTQGVNNDVNWHQPLVNGTSSGNVADDCYNGNDVAYEVDWEGGDFKAELLSSVPGQTLFLYDDFESSSNTCDGTRAMYQVTNTTGNPEIAISNLNQGKYYLVVDAKSGIEGDFSLKLSGDGCKLDCANAITLTPGTSDRRSNATGKNNATSYCGTNDLRAKEIVYKVVWPGGPFKANLSDIDEVIYGVPADLRMALLTDCNDLSTCGTITASRNLTLDAGNRPAGTYYLVVDGPAGNEGFYTIKVESAALGFCDGAVSESLKCGSRVSRTLKLGATTDPELNNVDTHGGQGGYTGPEVAYKINWDGGDFFARLEEKSPGQELILYSDCAAGDFIVLGTNEIKRNLSAGTYYLVVDGKNGADGKITLSLNNSSTPCLLPDLAAENLKATGCAAPGQTIDLEVTVKNEFGKRAPTAAELANAKDGFFLSASSFPDFNNPIASVILPTAGSDPLNPILLKPGEERKILVSLTIPQSTAPGAYYVSFFTDYTLVVDETVVAGNGEIIPISISNNSAPDYLPTGLTGPAAANPGEEIEMMLKINNQGTVAGQGNGGFDKYYLHTKDELDGSEILLTPSANTPTGTADIQNGKSFDVKGTVTIPSNTTPGDYFILFHHDADNKVAECNEENNVDAHPITIRTGNPDYIPLDFKLDGQTSLTVSRGQRVSGRLLAKNQGNSAGTSFTEGKYYYSVDDICDPATDLYLGEANDIEPLGAGMGTNEFESIKIPSSAQLGTGYICYWLDSEKRIPESNETNNYAKVMITVTEAVTAATASFTASSTEVCKGSEVSFMSTSTGGNTVLDQSPNEYDGKLNNANNPSVNGPSGFGKAIKLDGADDHVEASNVVELPQGRAARTMEAWIKTTMNNLSIGNILSWGGGGNRARNSMAVRQGKLGYIGENVDFLGSTLINDGQWHHVAISYDGQNFAFYVDGQKENVAAFTPNVADHPDTRGNTLFIGKAVTDKEYFSGEIDEVRIWSVNRTEAQIQQQMSGPIQGNEAGLVAYYDFEQALSGSDLSFSWLFPGGTPGSSTAANPKVTYATPGNYSVTLLINNGGQSDTEAKGNFISVKACDPNALDAEYTLSNSNPCPDASVQFNNSSIGIVSGSPVTYAWTFQGGTPATSSDENPSVSWTSPGTYDVVFTVTQNGVSNSTFGSVTVKDCAGTGGSAPDWPVVQTGDNHTVIVQNNVVVDIDGMGLNIGDYIGAFYMDGAIERCGGKIRWEGQNVSISIFGDDTGTGAKDGFSAGETFKWRIWKASSQQEFEVDVTYQPLGGIFTHQENYTTNGISGWATAIYDPIQVQTITLQPGWNIISSYIDATDPNMAAVFDAIKGSIALVKDEAGTTYIPAFDINGIGDWIVEEGYQVKVNGNSALDISIEGMQVDPLTTPLNLKMGWNFMAYLKDTPQNTIDALSGITDKIVLVKNSDGQTYVPVFNINRIGDMLPGQGYQIKLNADAIFNYSANARVAGPLGQEMSRAQHISSLQPDWPVVQTGDNHTIIIEGSIASDFDGASLLPGDYVGVFYDVEGTLVCGGKAEWTGENIAMSAFGDDSGSADKDGFAASETFVWKVWRASDGKEFDAMAEYSPTGAVISHTDMFTINGISGISSLTEATSTSISSFRDAGIKLFPNPSNGQFWIELPDFSKAEVKVFNYTGQLVKETVFQGESRKQVDLSNQPQGMYIVHVEQAGKIAISKVQVNP